MPLLVQAKGPDDSLQVFWWPLVLGGVPMQYSSCGLPLLNLECGFSDDLLLEHDLIAAHAVITGAFPVNWLILDECACAGLPVDLEMQAVPIGAPQKPQLYLR